MTSRSNSACFISHVISCGCGNVVDKFNQFIYYDVSTFPQENELKFSDTHLWNNFYIFFVGIIAPLGVLFRKKIHST